MKALLWAITLALLFSASYCTFSNSSSNNNGSLTDNEGNNSNSTNNISKVYEDDADYYAALDPYYQNPVLATYDFEPAEVDDEYGEPFYPEGEEEEDSADYNNYNSSGNGTWEEENTFQEYFVHQVSGFHTNQDPEGEGQAHDEDYDEEEEEVVEKNGDDLTPWKKEEGYIYNGGKWPTYPLFLIILGGLRHDLLDSAVMRNLTSFDYLRRHGSYVRKVKPVFPAEDYPVWTSLATGLYPEDHNIIGDIMFNLRTTRFFRRSDVESTRTGDWWKKVNPFWSTAAQHGRKVAMFNWHDCELYGKRLEQPGDCRPYKQRNDIQPRGEIAATFDEAFNRLYMQKYDISIVYTDSIRRAAEQYGVKSHEVFQAMNDIDDVMQGILTDIESKRERAGIKMNVMVVSDYGLTDSEHLTPIPLDQLLDMDQIQYIILSSGYASVIPYALSYQKILVDADAINSDGEDTKVSIFLGAQMKGQPIPIQNASLLPDFIHYAKGEWTQDILLIPYTGYRTSLSAPHSKIVLAPGGGLMEDEIKARSGFNPTPIKPPPPKKKIFGLKQRTKKTQTQKEAEAKTKKIWNYYLTHRDDMSGLAFGMGPDFKEGHEIDEAEIVDFYQILCFFLRLPPSPQHSGEWDRVRDMLAVSGVEDCRNKPITAILMVASFILQRILAHY